MIKAGKLAWVVLAVGCVTLQAQQSDSAKSPGPAESLYLKLRTVGLDRTRVYKIREASLNRASLHISLDDGTIAFTEDANDHITGAFFKGFGEVLLSPPSKAERASMALFTGAAILEEKFSTAYLRFNDDVLAELQPSLRTADDADAFVAEWGMTAHNLAEEDAIRLLLTFSESLPSHRSSESPNTNDHMLHGFLQGDKLGGFDVRYDSLVTEQIAAGQHKRVEGQDYYDVWTSFSATRAKASSTTKTGSGQEVETPNPGFDITNFRIQAEVRPPTQLEAKATLSIIGRQGARRALLFELSRLLQVKEVRVDGRPVEFIHNQAIEGSQLAKRGNDVIAVILPSALNAGQKAELSFDYSGAVLSEAANGLLYVGEHGTWYPNRGLAMAVFDMEFRYPPGWTLVATGRRVEGESAGPGPSSRWVSERPVPVAGFNLGKYSQTVTHSGKVAIVTYATSNLERSLQAAVAPEPGAIPIPELLNRRTGMQPLPLASPPQIPSPSQNAQMVGTASAKAVEFYEPRFGVFPYSELAITQMPGSFSQGWPGLIFLSSYLFLSPQEKARLESDPGQRLISEQVIAHETAHQWWGDLVIWNGYRDQWIMEGLANYSAMMLLESRDPAKFRTVMQKYRDDLLAKNRSGMPLMDAGPVTLGVRLSSSQLPNGYSCVSYGRGTWLFHMLRTMMRDSEGKNSRGAVRTKPAAEEPFLRALRKLRLDYEGRPVSTAELMAVFEAELPSALSYEGRKSLDWFYEGWVNGTAIPAFNLRNLKFTDKGTITLVSGTVAQEHAPEDLVTAIPLFASVAGKNIFLGHVFAEGREVPFRISAPAGTRKILLDPEQTLLSRPR
jgi:hypothetical protein